LLYFQIDGLILQIEFPIIKLRGQLFFISVQITVPPAHVYRIAPIAAASSEKHNLFVKSNPRGWAGVIFGQTAAGSRICGMVAAIAVHCSAKRNRTCKDTARRIR
jgi:hypothetical protein